MNKTTVTVTVPRDCDRHSVTVINLQRIQRIDILIAKHICLQSTMTQASYSMITITVTVIATVIFIWTV
jgi:hypothetical protein